MAGVPSRLAGPALVDATSEVIYTCPANRRAIVRHVWIMNPGAAATFRMSIGADAAATRIYDGVSIAEDVPRNDHVYFVLEAGDTLEASSSADDQMVVVISGIEELVT